MAEIGRRWTINSSYNNDLNELWRGGTSSAPAHYEIFSLNQSLDERRNEGTNERGRRYREGARRKEGEGVEGRIEGRGAREGLGPCVSWGRGREDSRKAERRLA